MRCHLIGGRYYVSFQVLPRGKECSDRISPSRDRTRWRRLPLEDGIFSLALLVEPLCFEPFAFLERCVNSFREFLVQGVAAFEAVKLFECESARWPKQVTAQKYERRTTSEPCPI